MACPKWVCNATCILAHVFNSASRQHHEVWASQFPFLHSIMDKVPASEACLCGHMNWSLAQAQLQSSMGLSFPPMREWQIQTEDWVHFQCVKETFTGVNWYLFGKETSLGEVIKVAETLLVVVSLPVLLTLGGREPWGTVFLMCYSPQPHHHLFLVCRLVPFLNS